MQDALLYATSNEMQKRDAGAALAAIIPGLKWNPGEKILDIGSGSGDVTVNLLARRIPVEFEIVGVDCSEQMVEFANQSFASHDISFQHLDIEKEENPCQLFPYKFSKAFSFYCLHWVKDLGNCLQNIHDLLIPGGDVVLVFLASNPIFSMYKILAEDSTWGQYMKDYEKYIPVYQNSSDPKQEFSNLLKLAGFETVLLEVNEHSFTYENKNQLIRAVKAINPFINRIPEAEQAIFLMDCLTTLLSLDVPTKNGKIEARYNLMVAHIKKKK